MKILIFGLPGSGKTSLSKELSYHFHIPHFNADPNFTFAISFIVIVFGLTTFGVYKAFFDNKSLKDPWDDHDD